MRTSEPAAAVRARLLSGRAHLPGFEAEVEIVTDPAGVPHVRASSRSDLYRTQGLLHGAERAWQADITSRTLLGRLSALIGPSGLMSDALFTRLGFPDLAERTVRSAPPEVLQTFAWYAQGWRAARALVPTTHEHAALGVPVPVPDARAALRTAASVLLLLGFSLQNDWLLALVRAALAGDPGHDGGPVVADVLAAVLRETGPHATAGGGMGSNAWVVPAGADTPGGPIVAGDPHLDAGLPGHWMPMHLTSPEVDMIGATLPGVPDVIIGHNGAVAWSTTFAPVATTTLVLERLRKGRTTVDRPGGGAERVRRTESVVPVRGLDAEPVRCEETEHGRLLGLELRGEEPGVTYDVAVRAAHREAIYDQRALAAMNRARSAEAFAEALRGWQAVPQTVVYADAAGTTGLAQIGLRPVVDPPDALVRGWQSSTPGGAVETRYAVSRETRPVVAANHVAGLRADGRPERGHWEAPLRADRIAHLLAEGLPTVAQSVRAQLDVHSTLAERYLPELLPAVDGLLTPQAEGSARRLAAWDGCMHRDAAEPLVFAAWLQALLPAAAGTDDAVVAQAFTVGKAWLTDWGLRRVEEWIAQQARTPGGRRALADALERAHGALLDSWGPASRWTWGARHTPVPRHRLSATAWGFAVPHVTTHAMPGGDDTVCRGDMNDPPRVGQSLRMVIDLAEPDRSVWAFPLGVSGLPSSPHFADQGAAWARGRYVPMHYTAAAIRACGDRTLTVVPAHDPAPAGGPDGPDRLGTTAQEGGPR